MNRHAETEITRLHVVIVCAGAIAAGIVLAAAVASAEETGLHASRVTVSGMGVFVDEDEDQFRQRHGIPEDFSGGVEDLHMEWGFGDGANAELDGRAMLDRNDYLARLRLEKAEKGYVSAGYREFRTWYDGTGGFFPQNNLLISYFDEDLHLDRGEAWLEAGLRLPNVPEVTARYAHLFRDGQKSSTAWGDSNLAQLTTGAFVRRNIVPSLWNIDETRDIVDVDVAHQVRKTDVGVGVLYESDDIDNSLNARRRPGEAGLDRFFTQKNDVSSDVWDAHAFSSTPFLDNRLVLSTSYAYGDIDNDVGGSRIYGTRFNAPYDPTFPNAQSNDEGFLDLDGSTELHQHTGTITVQGRPSEHLHLTAGLRGEREDARGNSQFIETNFTGGPPAVATQEDLAIDSETDNTRVTQSAEARYTGIANWVLWLDGEWEQEDGDLFEREVDATTNALALERNTDMDIHRQEYGAGATWYPAKRVNLSSRYSYSFDKYDFDHDVDSTPNTSGDRFPAFITAQNIFTHKADLRLTWRILSNLRATGRYDIKFSEFEQESDFLHEVQSAQIHAQGFGGNLSWNPTPASYVQADTNYVISETDTPADDLSGAADDLVVRFDNDYWTASLVGGLALDERTDLTGQYFYFRANDYDDNSTVSQPYGLDAEEHGFSLAVARQLTDTLRARLAYGFFTNDEKTAGGANDYTASALTGSLEVTF